MHLFSDLYIGYKIKDIGEVIYSLKRNIPMEGIYCLVLCEGKRMEIISLPQLCKGVFSTSEGMVVGVAASKKESRAILCQMLEEGMNPLDMGKWFMEDTDEVVC